MRQFGSGVRSRSLPGLIDGDGIADEWEIAYWGRIDIADENSDADHDSLTDLQEFTIGTDPLVSVNQQWDMNQDGVVGLEEAIHALRIISGASDE